MTESTPISNGPWPSYTLDPPQHPPQMTAEDAIAFIKHNYNYPADMPDEIWRTEYGALQEWGAPYPSVREEGTPWTTHVWKVTATGERLANYFIPTNRDQKPEPDEVVGLLVDDAKRRVIAGKVWHLDRAATSNEAVEGELIGTWRLVSWELQSESGEVTYPLGPDADGRITYTVDGRMSVLITAPGRKPYDSGDMFGATTDEALNVANGSVAYCGTYERLGDTVFHHVELSTFPNWERSEQERFISWQDGRLILSTAPVLVGGKHQKARLIWERVAQVE